jgi:hypothetical protein
MYIYTYIYVLSQKIHTCIYAPVIKAQAAVSQNFTTSHRSVLSKIRASVVQ